MNFITSDLVERVGKAESEQRTQNKVLGELKTLRRDARNLHSTVDKLLKKQGKKPEVPKKNEKFSRKDMDEVERLEAKLLQMEKEQEHSGGDRLSDRFLQEINELTENKADQKQVNCTTRGYVIRVRQKGVYKEWSEDANAWCLEGNGTCFPSRAAVDSAYRELRSQKPELAMKVARR